MDFLRDRYCYKGVLKRTAAAVLDAAGAAFAFFARALSGRRLPPSGPAPRILAVRIDQIGDLVMVLPALCLLRKKFPAAKIDFLVSAEAAPLASRCSDADEVIVFRNNWFRPGTNPFASLAEAFSLLGRIRRERYDAGIDFRGDLRTILFLALGGVRWKTGYGRTGGSFMLDAPGREAGREHQVVRNIRLLEPLGVDAGRVPDIEFKKEAGAAGREPEWAACVSRDNRIKKIVLHTEAGYPSKQWPAEYYLELIGSLAGRGDVQILLTGTRRTGLGPESLGAAAAHTVDLRGRTQVSDLPDLFRMCDLYIGNDSGPAHVAAACGIPLVTIFSGTNDAELWKPWSAALRLVTHPVSCSPCEARICPFGHHDCLRRILPGHVLAEAEAVLGLRGRSGREEART